MLVWFSFFSNCSWVVRKLRTTWTNTEALIPPSTSGSGKMGRPSSSVQHQHGLLIAMRQFPVILIIFIIRFTYISSDQNNDIANKRATHLTHFGLSVPGPFLHDQATLPSGPDRGHRPASQFTIEIMALGIQLVNNDNQNNGPLALLMITPLCCHDVLKKPAPSYPAVNASAGRIP